MFVVAFISLVLGVLLTLLVQWIFVKRWFYSLPVLQAPWKEQYNKFYLPKEIQEALRDPELRKKKETCLCLNLFFQFLFQELRDTKRLRRWVMRRMNMEFTDMLQTTTGKLLDQITVRDFSLGETFPILKNICIQNVMLKEETMMEELSLLLDVTYSGGFQLAVDVDMVFGKSAYLSVKVTKLQGRARLQLNRIPYTHWSFTFLEDPVMEFEVESHFEGRPVPQVTSLIVNQIRRSIRKKHTLPNYKIRYKPFFHKPEPTPVPQEIYYQGNKLSMGHLQITVTECNRLVKVLGGAFMYCTLALDTMPWLELMSSRRRLWVAHDIEILKTQGQNIGLSFKDEYIQDRYEDMVIVDVVSPYSPAALANLKKNDVVVAVAGVKVTNTKQAAKLMKQATDRLLIRVERSSSLKGLRDSNSSPDFKFEEDTISMKDPDIPDDPEPLKDEMEDYINITLTSSGNQTTPSADTKSLGKEQNGFDASMEDGGSNSSPSKKGFSILGSSAGLFHRKRTKIDRDKSPGKSGSPEPKVKSESQTPKNSEDEQKVKVTGSTAPAPDQQPKKCKDNGLQSSKDKAKDSNPRLETIAVSDCLDSGNMLTADDLEGHDTVDLKRTRFLRAGEDLQFDEKFDFDVEDKHNYLNVCVWCKIPEKLDKQSRIIKPEKDILLGHVSIPLMDIALECLATLQGDFQMTYKLTPAEMKAGASRTKISNLSAHPGFDEKLCYGDITMEFSHVHSAGPFSKMDRENISRIPQENELSDAIGEKRADGTKIQQTIKRPPPEAGKHDFVGTHFQSATYCNFCHKKIWLKTAFQCQVCGMVCHKKCTERCQAQTICDKEGFRIKEPPSTVFRRSVKDQNKEEPKDLPGKDSSPGSASHRASFLSKFRKEGSKGTEGAKDLTKGVRRPSTPEPTIDIESSLEISGRMRRNSAPEEEHTMTSGAISGEEPSRKSGLPGVTNVHRTQSSQSIADMVRAKLRSRKKEMESSGDSDDEDEEMNVLQFYEKQKASHNADELVVTAAKQMGRELYANLNFEQRKDKLDGMISKLQQEIDQESENRAELCRLERDVSDSKRKTTLKAKVEKSDEKVQSLALLMLHYCAGLQHCLEEQEAERQRRQLQDDFPEDAANEQNSGDDMDYSVRVIGQGERADDCDGQDDTEALVERLLSLGDEDEKFDLSTQDVGDSDVPEALLSAATSTPSKGAEVGPLMEKDPVIMSFQQLLSKEDSDSEYEAEEFVESGKESDAMSEDARDFERRYKGRTIPQYAKGAVGNIREAFESDVNKPDESSDSCEGLRGAAVAEQALGTLGRSDVAKGEESS